MEEILKLVAEFYEIPQMMLKSKLRNRRIVLPRQVAMYIIRQRPGISLHNIGDFFEKDHASVVHAVKTVKNLMESYPDFSDDVKLLLMCTEGIEVKSTKFCLPMKFPRIPVKI